MKTINDVDLLELPDPKDLSRYKGVEEDVRYFKKENLCLWHNFQLRQAHIFCLLSLGLTCQNAFHRHFEY
jgi:hypothetical protein